MNGSTCTNLRFTTTSQDYGRYLSSLDTSGSWKTNVKNYALATQFSQRQSRIGMYRNSSLNWITFHFFKKYFLISMRSACVYYFKLTNDSIKTVKQSHIREQKASILFSLICISFSINSHQNLERKKIVHNMNSAPTLIKPSRRVEKLLF